MKISDFMCDVWYLNLHEHLMNLLGIIHTYHSILLKQMNIGTWNLNELFVLKWLIKFYIDNINYK